MVQNITHNKKLIIFIICFFIAVIGLYFYYTNSKKIIAHQFLGYITEIKDNSIYVKGVFKSNDHPETLDPKNQHVIKINVNEDTRIVRMVVVMPTKEELEKTGGYFNASTLKRERSEVSLNDLIKDRAHKGVGIEVTNKNNIYNKSTITAEEIEYGISNDINL